MSWQQACRWLHTRGLQAWESPGPDNKQRLALLTSAGFGSGCSSPLSLACFLSGCEWRSHRMGGQPGRGPQLRLQGLAVFIWASPSKISFSQASLLRTGATTAAALFIRTMISAPTERGAALIKRNSCLVCGEEGRWRLDRKDGSCSHTYSCCAIVHPR